MGRRKDGKAVPDWVGAGSYKALCVDIDRCLLVLWDSVVFFSLGGAAAFAPMWG